MAWMPKVVGISLLSFVAVGCVPMEKYNAARLENDQSIERLAQAERSKAALESENGVLKQQLNSIMMSGDGKTALVLNQSNQINELQRQLDEMNRRYEDAVGKVGKAVVLDPQTNNALTEFARQNPDLVDFDSSRGIVKFKSDVTFNTGSSELTASARSAIDRFGSILNSPAAMGYELMVVGHTDDTPVQHQATIAAGHKDNWYLSAHRAISVGEELMRQGTAKGRLEVAGFAERRPIASNATSAGKQQNRRVEVLILPSTYRSPAPAVANVPTAPRRAAVPKPELNKDGFNKDATAGTVEERRPAFEERRPAFNK